MSPRTGRGPVGVAAYDIGRLLGEGLVSTTHLTREGLRDGLESVKRLPASSGLEGTTMGFGNYDHGALRVLFSYCAAGRMDGAWSSRSSLASSIKSARSNQPDVINPM